MSGVRCYTVEFMNDRALYRKYAYYEFMRLDDAIMCVVVKREGEHRGSVVHIYDKPMAEVCAVGFSGVALLHMGALFNE